MNRVVRFSQYYSNSGIASLTKFGSTFHGLTSTGTIASRGFSEKKLYQTHVNILLKLHLYVLLVHLLHWNVGHHCKLTLCMHGAQFKSSIGLFISFNTSFITNGVNNIRLDSSGWRSYILI